ncbi:RNA-binding protein [Reyranella sp.]|uniref:RNA-binding protein n=1 Tax=Reyranella sp. TaxID=1929291 RepID=UPI00272F0C89|nr:RNA-binding protein [Reyranella sp.]MDP2374058.1 RNA-binding protein [Reyranella sp.]
MTKRLKRPRDPISLAKLIGDIATGQVIEKELPLTDAQAFAQSGGLKGGKARAAKLSPEQRKAIAQKAAAKRWGAK